MQKVSEKIKNEFGCEIRVNGCRFSSSDIRPRVTILGGGGEKENFQRLASSFGMKPEWFGEKFAIGLQTFEITGINPRKRKNNVLIKRVGDGKGFVCSPYTVIQALKPNKDAPRVQFIPR